MAAIQFSALADIEHLNLVALWILTELSAAVWIVMLLHQGRQPRGALRSVEEAPWGLIDVWIIVLIWFAAASGASFVSGWFSRDKAWVSWVGGAASLTATGLGAAWLVFRYRTRAVQFLRVTNWRTGIFTGLMAFVAIVPPIFWLMGWLVRYFPYHHETLDQIKLNPTAWVLAASFFSAAVAAPIGEEFFFRLVLQSWLQRFRLRDDPAHRLACLYGDRRIHPVRDSRSAEYTPPSADSANAPPFQPRLWPIAASAAAFAALHFGQGPAPIALFILGLGLGFLYFRTGNLLSCIVLHATMNFYSLTWESLAALEHVARATGS